VYVLGLLFCQGLAFGLEDCDVLLHLLRIVQGASATKSVSGVTRYNVFDLVLQAFFD